MNRARQDWTGQILYASIDVHKAKWVVTVRTREVQLKTFVTEADKEILLKSFRHLYSGAAIEAVYEAGCFGYHLADFLNANGIKTIIVAPHTIPVAPSQFVKTDIIDSRKLAAELARGNLSGIYLRPREDLFDRGLLRKRAQHQLLKVLLGKEQGRFLFRARRLALGKWISLNQVPSNCGIKGCLRSSEFNIGAYCFNVFQPLRHKHIYMTGAYLG